MKITKRQLRRIIRENSPDIMQDDWRDAIIDFIYQQFQGGGDIADEAPMIIAALRGAIELLQDDEAFPHDGGMYGEDRY